jgi:hypothetical protein
VPLTHQCFNDDVTCIVDVRCVVDVPLESCATAMSAALLGTAALSGVDSTDLMNKQTNYSHCLVQQPLQPINASVRWEQGMHFSNPFLINAWIHALEAAVPAPARVKHICMELLYASTKYAREEPRSCHSTRCSWIRSAYPISKLSRGGHASCKGR